MKNLRFLAILAVVCSVFFGSCAPTNVMTLSVIEPAPVFVPKHVQHIGIVDRSLPSEGNLAIDDIDKILSAEGKFLDKEGAHKAILGLYDKLSKNQSFLEVKIIDDITLRSPGLGVFPARLSWEMVENICNANQLDALYVLSFYDTDAKVTYSNSPTKIGTPVGVSAQILEHQATIKTVIKTGWRIYNLTDKTIHDEYIIHRNNTVKGKGINPLKAIKTIAGRKETVLDISEKIGYEYAKRIMPYRRRVARDYFIKGTDNFEIAKRRAQSGDWDGAADLWNKEVTNNDAKIAGRAYYNMAIINEINGDLEKAVDWASKAYSEYDNKTALRYVNILKNRIRKNNLLKQQGGK